MGTKAVKSSLRFFDDFEHWMSKMPEEVKDLSFFHLAIPGTHNSLTYTLSPETNVGPDAPEFVQFLSGLCSGITRHVVYNWSVTQGHTVLQQLELGIRYFDIRLAMVKETNNPVVIHGVYGAEVGPLLLVVEKFLETHPGEVVILDFQHFYDFSPAEHKQLIAVLQDLFGPRLCPYWPGAPMEISLRWLSVMGYQVVLVYRSDYGRGSAGMWPSESLPNPWPNARSVQALLGVIERGLNVRDIRRGHVAQCVLTPSPLGILFTGLCSSLEKHLARPCNRRILSWLKKKKSGPKHGINIAIADFIDRDFVSAVVKLNLYL